MLDVTVFLRLGDSETLDVMLLKAYLQPMMSLLEEGCHSMQAGSWSSLKKPSGSYVFVETTLSRKMVLSAEAVANMLQSGDTDSAVTLPAIQ